MITHKNINIEETIIDKVLYYDMWITDISGILDPDEYTQSLCFIENDIDNIIDCLTKLKNMIRKI